MCCIPSMIDSHGFPLLPSQHPQQRLHSIHRVILESGERVLRVLRTWSLYRRRGLLTDGSSLPGRRFPKKTNQETNESMTSFCLSQPQTVVRGPGALSHEMAGKKQNLSELLSGLHDPPVAWLQTLPGETVDHLIFNHQSENSTGHWTSPRMPLLCKKLTL